MEEQAEPKPTNQTNANTNAPIWHPNKLSRLTDADGAALLVFPSEHVCFSSTDAAAEREIKAFHEDANQVKHLL